MKAYLCDLCGRAVVDAYSVAIVMVVDDSGNKHELTIVLNYKGERQGEYCDACIPTLIGRAKCLIESGNATLKSQKEPQHEHTHNTKKPRRSKTVGPRC